MNCHDISPLSFCAWSLPAGLPSDGQETNKCSEITIAQIFRKCKRLFGNFTIFFGGASNERKHHKAE